MSKVCQYLKLSHYAQLCSHIWLPKLCWHNLPRMAKASRRRWGAPKIYLPHSRGIKYTCKVVLYQVVVERESTPRCLHSQCMHAHKVTTPLQEISQHEDFGHPHSHTIQPHNNQMCAITTTVIVSFRVWKFCGIRRWRKTANIKCTKYLTLYHKQI